MVVVVVLLKKRKEKEAVRLDTVSHTGANTQLKQIAACSKQSRVHDVLTSSVYRGPRDTMERKRSRADERVTNR